MQQGHRLPTYRHWFFFLFWQSRKCIAVSDQTYTAQSGNYRILLSKCTVLKMKKITLNGKKIRKINDLLISLVKPSLSRNFCQKRVRANFRNFHTVYCGVCWFYRNFHRFFSWKLREINVMFCAFKLISRKNDIIVFLSLDFTEKIVYYWKYKAFYLILCKYRK